MTLKRIAALTFILALSACSGGSSNDAIMLATANAYSAKHPVCTTDMLVRADNQWALMAFSGSPAIFPNVPNNSTPAWTLNLEKDGVLVRKIQIDGNKALPGYHMLVLSSAVKPDGYKICVGYVVADSVAKVEPVPESYAAYGISKDARKVEFRSHFAYENWANDPAVQAATWGSMLNPSQKDANVPALNAVLYDDPVTGWRVIGTGQP